MTSSRHGGKSSIGAVAVWCLPLVFGGVAACGETGGQTRGDGSLLLPDGGRDALLVPDVWVPNPTGDTCSPMDLLGQRQCGGMNKCTVVDGQVGCAAQGSVGLYSPCTPDASGDDCVGGSLCADPLGDGLALCLPFCRGRDSACETDGTCSGPVGTNVGLADLYLCLASDGCDPVSGSGGICDSSQSCKWAIMAGDVTVCIPSGTGNKSEGSSCSSFLECSAGLTCAGPTPEERTCIKVCHVGSGETECGTGRSCSAVGSEVYGLCSGGS